jgi:hypothetical protein
MRCRKRRTDLIAVARDALYVVVATMENGVAFTRLHAIGVGSGNELATPTVITGSVALATGGTASISSVGNLNRAALLEANGNIYVALGSHCDFGTSHIHGWVIAYSAATLQETGNLVDLSNANSGDNYFLGSPWMSGFGPAADAQGNVYFATGNGPFDGRSNFSMSVMKVPGDLNLGGATFFAPVQAKPDSDSDQDLRSGGVLVLPDEPGGLAHLLVAGGKCSANNVGCFKHILNRDLLGGQQNNNAGAVWTGNTGGDLYGGPAYFVDANGGQHVVLGGAPLNTYNLSLGPPRLAVQSSTNMGCLECRNGGGSQPTISSNGTTGGSALAWALKTPGNGGGTISLYAFDPLNMGTTLFSAPAGSWIQAPGTGWIGGALISPVVANGLTCTFQTTARSAFSGCCHDRRSPMSLRTRSLAVAAIVALGSSASAGGWASAAIVSSPVPLHPTIVRGARPLPQIQVRAPLPSGAQTWHAVRPGPHVLYGTIAAVRGNVITLRLRNGRAVAVDATVAIAHGDYPAPLFIGKVVSFSNP